MKIERIFVSPLTLRQIAIQQPPVRVEPSGLDKKSEAMRKYASPSSSKPDAPQRKINPISRSKYGNSR